MWRPAAVSLCVAFFQLPAPSTQTTSRPAERRLSIPASPVQPAIDIKVSADGQRGTVEVRGPGITQTLTCELAPFAADLFVTQMGTVDLDMDGAVDLRGVREFGAKWGRYCVWLFDKRSRMFTKPLLAEQMELLYNLDVDLAHHRVIQSSIGPVRPEWNVFRIVGDDEFVARQLLPELSCVIDTDPSGGNATAIVTRFANGRTETQRQRLSDGDDRSPKAICDQFGGTR